jgi:hypothetical protein
MNGKKLDQGKLPMDVIFHQFPRALEGVVECSKYGHELHKLTDLDWNNWSRVENGKFRYAQALTRHRIARAKGEEYDLESGLPHIAHQAWNALAQLELYYKSKQKSDEPV